MQAGELDCRVTLSSPTPVTDEYGNEEQGYTAEFTVWAKHLDLRGGEQVMAARLQGRQPSVFTVRSSAETRGIVPEWRLTVERTGAVYNVRAVSRAQEEPDALLDLLCETGVAA